MTVVDDNRLQSEDERLEQAAEWFLRVRSESARMEDIPDLQRWIDADELNAVAYQQVAATWSVVGEHASAPEIVRKRRDALMDSHAEHASDSERPLVRGSWLRRGAGAKLGALAAAVLLIVAGGAWWALSPQSTLYSTALGEQRTVTLADGSVLLLDARSRARIRYTDKERAVTLEQGQARFTVAKDPLRPFRVRAGDETVVALGTAFDIELLSRNVVVTLIEGHVAVAGSTLHPPDEQVIELTPGQALRVHEGHGTILAVDLNQANAWQRGKVLFYNEPLATAVERISRYSRTPIEVDPSVATFEISGAFNAGDTDAFVDAVTSYFPVETMQGRQTGIYLTRRK